jgi:hypothetical protein
MDHERRRFARMIAGNKRVVVAPAMLDIRSRRPVKKGLRGDWMAVDRLSCEYPNMGAV